MARQGVERGLAAIPGANLAGPARLAAAMMVLLSVGAAMAATGDEIRATARDVLFASDYQRDLPRKPNTPLLEQSEEAPRSKSEAAPPDFDEPPITAPRSPSAPTDILGDVGRIVLWVVVLAGGALLVFYLLNQLPIHARRARRRETRKPRTPSQPLVKTPAAPGAGLVLAEWDRLADDGNYGEAVHALLLRSLEDIRRRLDHAPRPSLTSREIVDTVTLSDSAKTAFTLIVRAAERSHFGGRTPDRIEFLACRENYRRLAVGSGGAR